jgi:hypothetical protein
MRLKIGMRLKNKSILSIDYGIGASIVYRSMDLYRLYKERRRIYMDN